MRALIVEDGSSRGALAAVRSLGRAGWVVGVASPVRGLAALSRWAHAWHVVPGPAAPDEFIAGIAAAVGEGAYSVVLPAGDPEVLSLSERRTELGATFPYPPHDNVLRAFDKIRLAESGRRVGLSVPRAGIASQLEPPLIVKPRLRVGTPLAPVFAENARDAERAAAALRDRGAEAVVQEHVAGRLAAYVVLVDAEGKIAADCYQVADAIWPELAGGSVRARTETVDERLRRGVELLIKDLGWYGLAQVQFILRKDGEAVLLDVNGRLYGSLALAAAAGADLPRGWAELAITGRTSVASARAGVRYQALDGDLLRSWRGRRRARTLASSLRYMVGSAGSISRLEDPVPSLLQARRLVLRGARRFKRAGD